MAIVVEDGTCVPTANAFVTRDEFNDYLTDKRPDLVGELDVLEVDAAIVRASSWISTFPNWSGSRTCGRNQGLAWPREEVTDCDGDLIPSDEVPIEVKEATFAAALAEVQSPLILTPTITPGTQVKRVKVDVIEQEFMTPSDQGIGGENPLDALRPMVAQVQDWLKCLATFPNDTEDTPYPWVA